MLYICKIIYILINKILRAKYSRNQYRKILKRRNYKSFLRKIRFKKKRKKRLGQNQNINHLKRNIYSDRANLRKQFKDFKWIQAPSNFSLIDNPEESINFIGKINESFNRKRQIFIDLENVTNIGHGAIVVLLSKMVQFKANNILFNGNFPKENKPCRMLIKSGFFENLYKEFNVQDTYDLSTTGNSIYTHAQKTVNSELTDTIIRKSSSSVWGEERRCPGLQRVFLELMQNTNNHASETNGEKHWWMSINYRQDQNKICFSFLDFGVGIFESLSNKKEGATFYGVLDIVKKIFKPNNNSEILKLLLMGEIHKTASKKYYRGKGLPGIYNAFLKKEIKNLKIISNNAYADTNNSVYKNLNNNFAGTFIYWELTEDSYSLKLL